MKRITLCLLMAITGLSLNAQKTLIDDIVAIVGSEIILRSDIENQVQQMFAEGTVPRSMHDEIFCTVMEQSIVQKMLLMQARFDSVPVTEDQVEGEMDRRLEVFMRQAGGKDNLEKALGKTIDEIKVTFRKTIHDQLLIQSMQQSLTGSARVTPGEVRDFFNSIPTDSLPYIASEVQIGQLVIKPPIRESERTQIKEQLNEIRNDIINGASFSLKAKLWSMDKGSAPQGGELGSLRREDLVENFAAAAFNLELGEVSEVIETEFGYHIIALIEKRGEYANFRHILLQPQVKTEDVYKTLSKLDSIYQEIQRGNLTFSEAALKFSDDENTKNNGGLLINPINGSTKFTMDELVEIDGQTFRTIEKLKVGEITEPFIVDDNTGGKVVKIMYIVSKTEPHVADLSTDYAKIQQAALQEKQARLVNEWVEEKLDKFYIWVSDEFKSCTFEIDWYNSKTQ